MLAKDFKLHSGFDSFFKEMDFSKWTEIQKKAIPMILEHKSLVAISSTGSGKTLSFAIPLSQMIKDKEVNFERTKAMPLAVVVAPTRELASQIFLVFKKMSHHLKFRPRLLSSGKGEKRFFETLGQPMDVLVATPVAIKSALDKKKLDLSFCQHIVLDEADQLLDMGFSKDLGVLYQQKTDEACISFFSATMSSELHQYIISHFSKLKFHQISLDANVVKSKRIETFNVHCSEAEKLNLMELLIKRNLDGRGLIFVNQKSRVKSVFDFISEKFPKLKVDQLHGDLSGKEREKAFKAFKDKKTQILICTDITARGIDVDDLAWVVNLELPKSHVYYLHRSGRVARGKLAGAVYNFISHYDQDKIAQINQLIKEQKNLNIDIIKVKNAPINKPAKKKAVKKPVDTKQSKAPVKAKHKAVPKGVKKKAGLNRYGTKIKKRT